MWLLQTALFLGIAQGFVAYADITDRQKLVLSADDYMKQGEFQKALVQLQKARSQDSFEFFIDQKMRACQMRLGNWVSSEGSSQVDWIEVDKLRLEDVPIRSFDSLFHVAQGLEARENYETALRIFNHIAERAPAKAEYGKASQDLRLKLEQLAQNHSDVGEMFLKQGRFLKALEEFNRALYYKPQDAFLLDRVKLVEARHAELLDTYRSRLTKLVQAKERDQAAALAERAFREFPEDKGFRAIMDSLQTVRLGAMRVMLDECRSQIDVHKYSLAESRLREALVAYPGEPEVNELLQEVRQKIDADRRIAIKDSLDKAFSRAIRIENAGLAASILQSMHTQFSSADFSAQQKKIDELNVRLQKIQDFQTALEHARQAMRDGLLSVADSALQNALALDPASPVAKKMLEDVRREQAKTSEVEVNKHREVQKAQALVKAGQIKEAKKADLSLTGARQVDQEVKQVQRTIREAEFARTPENDKKAQELFLEGIAKYRVGDYKEALDKWNQVTKLNPDHDQAKKYIANVKQKLARMQ